MTHDINSKLAFLARDPTYDSIKPYSLRFTPPDDSKRHNLIIEQRSLSIHDARQLKPTIEQHGFTLTSVPTRMTYSDFEGISKIESVYAVELEAHLKNFFQAPHVKIIDYAVRRRHPDFPISTGEEYADQQPASLVHLDFSHNEGINMLRTLYGDDANDILQHRWQIINAWRPLRGPLFDWPLAVCDAQTFRPERDAQISDAVYPEWAYENVLVHFHPHQRWYYFSAMQDSETMLFKCTDSDDQASRPCPHGAFPNSISNNTERPRESIESRAFVMWSPINQLPQEVGSVYGKRKSNNGEL